MSSHHSIDSNKQNEPLQPVLFHPRRLAHANIFVSQLEQAMAFFQDVCGLEVVGTEPEIRMGFLSNGNSHHDIGCTEVATTERIGRDGHIQVPKGRGNIPGINHFGWEMENEASLVSAYQRAIDAGLTIHRTVDHQIAHSVYLFDPDGNLHEFYADYGPDWRQIMRGGALDLLTGNWTPGVPTPTEEIKYPVDPEIRHVGHAIFHPKRLARAAIFTHNWEKMRRFLVEVAGLKIMSSPEDGLSVCFGGLAGGMDLILLSVNSERPFGLHHISFEVESEDELDAAERKLMERSMPIERKVDLPSKKSIFIRSPDGIIIEFYKLRALQHLRFAEISPLDLPYIM